AALAALRDRFAPLAVARGLPDFDLSAVTSAHRLLTQRIARHLYEQTSDAGEPLFAGIRYPSRLGGSWTCWAVFSEQMRGVRGPVEAIFPDDPGLRGAANLFGLSIASLHGTILPPQRAP
ncbi:MAG: RES domain-containing protein, partial [Chloroflexota bacterium]|nr:RES domain-containing protein [Chloroflexota bacterium]